MPLELIPMPDEAPPGELAGVLGYGLGRSDAGLDDSFQPTVQQAVKIVERERGQGRKSQLRLI